LKNLARLERYNTLTGLIFRALEVVMITKKLGIVYWQSRASLLRKLGLLAGDWKSSLPKELQFWDDALKDDGRYWDQDEWRNCTNPDLELQEDLKSLIPAPAGSVVRILDVGSGPLTRVGKRWEGRQIEIVPTDPLAEQYALLLSKHGIKPLVPSVFAHGEKLLDRFKTESFDLAYASNSLDHTYDPLTVIRQMLALVKPSHYVYLWHMANEGMRECYNGLHQWNFDIRKDHLVISDGRRPARSISAELGSGAEISCEFRTAFGAKAVVARIKKVTCG
jgi:SAM-dependent methyltransferase